LKKQYAVIGLGRFGTAVALTLAELGHEVLGVDREERRIQEVAKDITHVVEADATDEESLKALGLRNFDTVVVSIGEDIQANILVTLLLKELGVKQVVARAVSDLHGKVLERIGADRVVFPERDMGARVAHNLVTANLLDYIELAPNFSVAEIMAGEKLSGRTLRDLNLRARYGVNVMAIKRGQKINLAPRADDVVAGEDVLVVIGKHDDIAKLQEE